MLSPLSEAFHKPHLSFFSLFRFRLSLIFKIPHILIDPTMDVAQDTIKQVILSIINISDSLSWWSGERKGQAFNVSIVANNKLQHIVRKVETTMRGIYKKFSINILFLHLYIKVYCTKVNT